MMPIVYEKIAEGVIAASNPEADARRAAAWNGIALSGAMKTITADEAQTYITQQVVGDATLEGALLLVDNAASLDDVKFILRAIVSSIFATVGILLIMARMLVALRDFVRPEIVDEE